MTDNNTHKIVTRVVIELDDRGGIKLTGPENSPLMILGMLQLATGIVQKKALENSTSPKPNIVIPTLVPPPKRSM